MIQSLSAVPKYSPLFQLADSETLLESGFGSVTPVPEPPVETPNMPADGAGRTAPGVGVGGATVPGIGGVAAGPRGRARGGRVSRATPTRTVAHGRAGA